MGHPSQLIRKSFQEEEGDGSKITVKRKFEVSIMEFSFSLESQIQNEWLSGMVFWWAKFMID